MERIRVLDQRCYEQLDEVRGERDAARRWSAAWKRAAKANKARHLHDVIKYKLKYRTAVKERDEARAQLANAAASEVEAVQGRQECEAELREARRRLRFLAECFAEIGRIPEERFQKAMALALSIVEEDSA